MLGFDAIGALALGQAPTAAAPASTTPFNQYEWATPKRLRSAVPQLLSVNLALIATLGPFSQGLSPPAYPLKASRPHPITVNNSLLALPFSQLNWSASKKTGFAVLPVFPNLALIANLGPFRQGDFGTPRLLRASPPQPIPFNLSLIANLGPFTQTNWNVPLRPMALPAFAPFNVPLFNLEETPFTNALFTASARFRLNPVAPAFNLTIYLPIQDTHDGVWVKRKRKRHGPDPIDLELQEKASRRAALELAVYGPEVEYREPSTVVDALPPAPPNVAELAQVIASAQAAQHQQARLQAEQDDEDDLEAILREIL